jgi:hypothetical protein
VGPAHQRAERGSGERGWRAGKKWAGERSSRPRDGKEEERRGRPRLGRAEGWKGRWAGPAGLGHKEKKKKKEKEEWAGPTRKKRNAFEMHLNFN